MNVKHIAATLAILGSASFTLTGCKKNSEGTEVPGGGDAQAGDKSCSGEGGCSGKCSGKKEGEESEGAGDAAGGAEGEQPAEPPAAS